VLVKTICRDCIFKIEENDQQSGCHLGRLEKFKEKNKAKQENNYFCLDGLCNTSRDTKRFQDFEFEKEYVMEEVSVPFYLFVNCTDQEDIPEQIIEDIKLLNYPKIKVHFIYNSGNFVNIFKSVSKAVDKAFKFKVSKLNKEESINFCVAGILSKLDKNHFICFSDYNNRIVNDVFNNINNRINIDLSPLVCYIDVSLVAIYGSVLDMVFRECTSVLDIDFYISRIIAWAQSQDKGDLIWTQE